MANIAPDLSVFGNIKTVNDFNRLNDEFALKKQLAAAQLQKANEFDIDKVGQQAFVKAANGMPLSQTEQASLQYLDSKQQTVTFNPVTGALEQKPSLLQRAGVSNVQPQSIPSQSAAPVVGTNFRQAMTAPASGGGGDFLEDLAPVGSSTGAPAQPQQNEWDIEANAQIAAAKGNPKLQQEIRAAHAKNKISMNESESKNAGYADRLATSNPLIEQYQAAGMNNKDVRLDRNLPDFIANRVVSDDYQSFSQAQRDFINAQLRRESGAVIADSEFKSAAQQYFPQVGDSAQVLLQKKANRENAVKSLQRSAGPAYVAPKQTVINPLQAEFDAKKGYQETPNGIKYRVVK